MDEPTTFVFKILNLGSLNHLLPDGKTYLCRPSISLDGETKKWGSEYVLIPKNLYDDMVSNHRMNIFLGGFGKDKNGHLNLKMIKQYDAPIRPDYFIVTMKHRGQKLSKVHDMRKSDPTSFSKIFSSAYHKKEETDFVCETILIVQNGDEVNLGSRTVTFSARSEKFE